MMVADVEARFFASPGGSIAEHQIDTICACVS